MVFGELTVLCRGSDHLSSGGRKFVTWKCRCSCGNETTVKASHLMQGKTKSCGCLIRRPKEDLTGKRFGRLTVLQYDTGRRGSYWICQCDCGNTKSILASNLKQGLTMSCGCYRKQRISESLTNDLVGKRFGRLIVLKKTDERKNAAILWECKCDCGNIIKVRGKSLVEGNTKSCGCLKRESTSQNLSYHLENQKFGRLTVIERAGTFIGRNGTQYSQWLCQCECGTKKIVRGADLVRGSISSCGCLISRGEEKIRKILNDSCIKFKTQYWFDDLRSEKGWPLFYDFALINDGGTLVALIEYQGQQHFYEDDYYFGKQQRDITDPMKREYCKNHNIPLFEITYLDDIEASVKNILSNLKIYKSISCQAS